jgi:hypothetical protein
MPEGHRAAARSVLDGREHGGTLDAETGDDATAQRLPTLMLVQNEPAAVYVRVLAAANSLRDQSTDRPRHDTKHAD